MAFTLKDGQGTLHRNDKGGVETRPDYRGQLMIGGATYEIAGWIKDGAKGKWLSLSAKVAEERAPQPEVRSRVDEDIPW